MHLSIYNCDDLGFVFYVIRFLRKYILQKTDFRKLANLDKYLNTLDLFKNESHIITCKLIVTLATSNLVIRRFHDEIVITINNNKKIPGTNAKLYDLCKLINYGTISIPGSNLFTKAFNYVADNIEFLYYSYEQGFNY